MTRSIEVYGADHEHTLDLFPAGDDPPLIYKTASMMTVFARMLGERAYEVCEFSLANYIMLKDRGADWLHAIPVFPYRAFRHATLYVRKDSPLSGPIDLRGKRVAVPDFSMTAAVWTRGILAEQYDVDWQDIAWVTTRRQRFETLQGVELEKVDADLEALFLAGEVDAILSPDLVDARRPASERQSRSLIADVQQAEEDYVTRFGVYPINHVIVIRSDILAFRRDLPKVLFEAYSAAKQRAYARRLGTTLMPWGARHWAKVFDMFDGDPLPYGLTPTNLDVVSRLAGFLHDQRLIEMQPSIPDLFLSIA